MHIGLIGGIGPAATQFYYRNLVAASKAAGKPYQITITHADNAPLVQNFLADRRDEQAQVFAAHLANLKGAGAQVGAVTALAAHYCIAETIAASPLPLINAVDVIRAALADQGIKRIGVLGAGRVMETGLWGAFDNVEQILPAADERAGVGQSYLDMAQRGACFDAERDLFFEQGRKMINRGAEAVFLAGTDLFLAFENHDPGYPVIDGGALHIAALAQAAEQEAA